MMDHLEVTAPYPGLRPFEPSEAEIFFGRELHVDRLLEILQREHFLAVIGPSGSGKSSLVRAGMLPALAAGWLGTGSDWRIVVIRPGDRPVRRLAHALLEPTALAAELGSDGDNPAQGGHGTTVSLIEAELRRGPLGLVHLVEDARLRPPSPLPFDLLVVVDQFEEIFRYSERSLSAADESDAFVNMLLASRAAAKARIYVALTMRTDFLGHCVRFFELPEAINRCQYLTPRLSRDQLESAIVGPPRVFGGNVEPELTNELINAVGDVPDQLPVLQHALARMWDSAVRRNRHRPVITRLDLAETGGIAGALSRHADSILDALTSQQRQLAEVLFRSITERRIAESDAADTRRPLRLRQIEQSSGRCWQDFVPVIQAFSQKGVNFLTHDEPLDADARVDISHEALIRQWQRLQAWVVDEADRARDYQRWRDRAIDWEQGGELLSGADLARAIEWRTGKDDWQSTAAWAGRYALDGAGDAEREYARTLTYIAQSETRERAAREAEEAATRRGLQLQQQRLEAEKRAAEAQAEAERQKADAERARAEADRERFERQARGEREKRLEQRAKSARIFKILAIVLGMLVLGALWATHVAMQQSVLADEAARRAEEQSLLAKLEGSRAVEVARSAKSRELAAAAVAQLTFDRDLSLLLALEAVGVAQTNEAVSALRQAVSQFTPGPIPLGPDTSALMDLAFSPDGKHIVTGDATGVGMIWDLDTHTSTRLPGHAGPILSVAFSYDGTEVATASDDDSVRIWKAGTGAVTQVLDHDMAKVMSVAFHPHAAWIVTAHFAPPIARIWNWRTTTLERELRGPAGGIYRATFSPDGRYVAAGSEDTNAYVWEARSAKLLWRLAGHQGAVHAIAFSPDSRYLLTGGLDKTARIWDLHTGMSASGGTYAGVWNSRLGVRTVSFSFDGAYVVTASRNSLAWVWDARTGSVVQEVKGNGALFAAQFSPASMKIGVASIDGAVEILQCETCATGDNLVRLAYRYVTRKLTAEERQVFLHEPR